MATPQEASREGRSSEFWEGYYAYCLGKPRIVNPYGNFLIVRKHLAPTWARIEWTHGWETAFAEFRRTS